MSTFYERLQEERKRLGLSQSAFGEVGGVQKRAQINYESGDRSPDASYLERIAAAGADVLYVLTGRRAQAPRLGTAEPDAALATNLAEIALLNGYRRLDAKGRQAVTAMIEALTQAAPSQVFNGPVENIAGRDVKHVTTGDVKQGKGGRIG